MESRDYASPRDIRNALDAANGDWTCILSPAQLDQPIPAEQWGGHTTLRAWLADGADRRSAAIIWPLIRQH